MTSNLVRTYRPRILFEELWPIDCDFHVVSYLRLARKSAQGRREGLFDMMRRGFRDLHGEAGEVEIRRQAVCRGTRIIERQLEEKNNLMRL